MQWHSPLLVLGLQQVQIGVPLVADHLQQQVSCELPLLLLLLSQSSYRHGCTDRRHVVSLTFPQVKQRTGMIMVAPSAFSLNEQELNRPAKLVPARDNLYTFRVAFQAMWAMLRRLLAACHCHPAVLHRHTLFSVWGDSQN